ncbi:MAG: phytanoyl-CoA dioxygenase family protein [SAR202 cluster bacterium]|jgi:ectoine hydroxylase-related dioxygenase (phytanoyl-CoA dioxygenase family)|nr:phytanoyl-CoA dioxygenase family protein [SAR202 cluster bacterium]
MTSSILAGESLSPQKTQQIVDQFLRDGYVHVPNVITASEIASLRKRADEFLDNPALLARDSRNSADEVFVQLEKPSGSDEEIPFVLRNTVELDQVFRDMLLREPIFSLAEAILSFNWYKGMKFVGQNVIRNKPGLSIDQWHADAGEIHFPLPESIERHDPRIQLRVLWLTVQVPLSDIELIEHGPTQYIPGSHHSGRHPNDQENPEFDGKGPASVFCKAGDIYIQNSQTWHRGAPNTSDRVRYLMNIQYASIWPRRSGRALPIAENALEGASDRFLDLVGRLGPST